MLRVHTLYLSFSSVFVNSLFAKPSVGERLFEKHGASHFLHLQSFTPFCKFYLFCHLTTLSHLSLFPPLCFLCLHLPPTQERVTGLQLAVLLLFDVFSLFCTLWLLQKWWYVIVPVLWDVQHYIDWSESENERGYWPYLRASIKIIL